MLPGFHCIYGCDSSSSLSGIGKKKDFGILKRNFQQLLGLLNFGGTPELAIDSDATTESLKVVCMLCDEKFKDGNVKVLRYKLFTKKVYQEKNYHRRANQAIFDLTSPVGNGWIIDDKDYIL